MLFQIAELDAEALNRELRPDGPRLNGSTR
jgi:hypothetical protein